MSQTPTAAPAAVPTTPAPLFTPVAVRFALNPLTKAVLRRKQPRWGYGQLSEFVFMRTYAHEGESLGDVAIRVTEGTFSILKDRLLRAGGEWDEVAMQREAIGFANAYSAFRWGPPGRGHFTMGRPQPYLRGATALNNCAYVHVRDLATDVADLMNLLMLGVGVGFSTYEEVRGAGLKRPYEPYGGPFCYVVPDTRQGWCESVRVLIRSYLYGQARVVFDYARVRPEGAPIATFGGKASGPGPLKRLHEQLCALFDQAIAERCNPEFTSSRLITDVCNLVGACVVAGNVRRSALIALGKQEDDVFVNLKNYERFPERAAWAWMSNNSVVVNTEEELARLPELAARIVDNGEPGFLNRMNVTRYGRMGEERAVPDRAVGANPCGEIALEDGELCCLAEVYPTRNTSLPEFLEACRYAAIYTSAVSALGTDMKRVNRVVNVNHRQGVGLTGVADWRDTAPAGLPEAWAEAGYAVVAAVQDAWGKRLGFPGPIVGRTTVKPSGTVSLLAGVSAGGHWRTGAGHYLRRVRIAQNASLLREVLETAGVPHEPDVYSAGTEVYEFPIGPTDGIARSARSAGDVSLWEQGEMVVWLAEHWSDNMVSYTVSFSPERMARELVNRPYFSVDAAGERQIDPAARMAVAQEVARFLAWIAPKVKSLSMLPVYEGVYAQLPEEPISAAEYARRKAAIKPFDWSAFRTQGIEEKFCDGANCQL